MINKSIHNHCGEAEAVVDCVVRSSDGQRFGLLSQSVEAVSNMKKVSTTIQNGHLSIASCLQR